MAHRIKEINSKLGEIETDKGRFKFDVNPVLAPAASSESSTVNRETASFVANAEIVGRKDDKSKIVDMLLQKGNVEDDDIVSVIPIVGFGGLGKTTLAQLIYNDVQIQEKFDIKMWVWVSNNFDIKKVMREMIESLSKKKIHVSSMDVLQTDLRAVLDKMTFLLVLDDMWNEEHFLEKWDTLSSLFRCANQGSKIVVTTRSKEVASIVGTLRTYDLKLLPDNDCWDLFEHRAFSNRGPKKSQALETIGKEIVKKCAGVPLALKTLGGLMQSKHQEKEWLDIQNSPIWDISNADKKIMNVLKLSFESLAPPLKQCFLYCSIFSKGYRIGKKLLIQLWMAEGFLGLSRGSKTMEDVGSVYFDNLCSNSLFQDIEKNKFGDIKGCKMHDLVHDLVTSISGSECSVIESNEVSKDVLHIHRLVYNSNESRIPRSLYEARMLRTFYVWNNFEVEAAEFENVLLNFNSLRVLDLSFTSITQLPASIGKLKHLRFLDISKTRIKELPKSITCLYNLQTLRMKDCKNLKELPPSLGKLINLRHLKVDLSGWTEIPKGIGKVSCLQTLPVFRVGRNGGGRVLAELENLNSLQGKLKIYDLDVVEDVTYAETANLKAKQNIYSLGLEWDRDEEVKNINIDNEVLEALQPHSNLKELWMRGFSGTKFPGWIISGSWLGCLIEIYFYKCNNCEYLPSFGQLPSLKKIHVDEMRNLKHMGGAWNSWNNDKAKVEVVEDAAAMAIVAFPSLEIINLKNMPNLEEWLLESTCTSFPRLETLYIEDCPKLKIMPSCFHSLKSLDFTAETSAIAVQSLTKNLTNLTFLYIHGCPDLKFLPIEFLLRNKFLHTLKIDTCPEFEGFVSKEDDNEILSRLDEIRLDALEALRIRRCPKFHMIPNTLPSLKKLLIEQNNDSFTGWLTSKLTALTYLWIEDIPNLEYLPSSLLKNNERLTELSICGCPSLKDFLYVNGNKLKSLSELVVRDCPSLTSLELQGLTSLSYAEIVKCGGLSSLPEDLALLPQLERLRVEIAAEVHYFPFPEATQQHHFLSLRHLQIGGSPKLKSLPHQLQYLTKLKILVIHEFDGLSDLPEWLGGLTLLESLTIWSCRNLIRLPSMEAMRRLSLIEYLFIEDCPLLKENCDKESGEEWEKISHISKIKIDEDYVS
ncbi:hypothetical protein Scep_010414 [Stephania cephalantha]|uniref:NB-ARC domain-containing protein n=1 Tax=Stephania cephalantha TaxID=152367 RepID=A0AAP0JWA2_9MAGN